MNTNRPKIGLALSGSAGRAIAHIGIIEVFRENGIPIDIVVGCSSGALVAVSYATDTLDILKELCLSLNRKLIWSYVSLRGSRGGFFNMHNAVSTKKFKELTKDLKFEDLSTKVGVTTSDIQTGELITITRGDLIPALKATIALPGLFEPVVINDRILVDGGLINIVPTIPTKQLGADIVIGIDLARSKFLYQRKLWFWRIIRFLRRVVGIEYIQYQVISPLTSKILDHLEKINIHKRKRVPNMFRIFFWGVDHSFDVEKELSEEQRTCDLMIDPEVKEWSGKWGLKKIEEVYEEGRKAGLESVPKVRELIAKFEQEKVQEQEKVLA